MLIYEITLPWEWIYPGTFLGPNRSVPVEPNMNPRTQAFRACKSAMLRRPRIQKRANRIRDKPVSDMDLFDGEGKAY